MFRYWTSLTEVHFTCWEGLVPSFSPCFSLHLKVFNEWSNELKKGVDKLLEIESVSWHLCSQISCITFEIESCNVKWSRKYCTIHFVWICVINVAHWRPTETSTYKLPWLSNLYLLWKYWVNICPNLFWFIIKIWVCIIFRFSGSIWFSAIY